MNQCKLMYLLMFLLCCSAIAGASTEDEALMRKLESIWLPIDYEVSVTYSDYIESSVRFDTDVSSVIEFPCPLVNGIRGRVAIYVNSLLFEQIDAEVYGWVSDITADGFDVVLVEATFETVSDMRASMQEFWLSEAGLVGSIIVGDFPVPWFAMGGGAGVLPCDFPCDLFYEDMDGTFIDSDEDGMFDGHEDGDGDFWPDIFIGRLTPSTLSGVEAEHIRGYLQRNHLHRTGQLNTPARGLVFIDDDWEEYSAGIAESLHQVYRHEDIVLIDTPSMTNAQEYLHQLTVGYEWVQVDVHSDPGMHRFKYRGSLSIVESSELALCRINALFFDLFACSITRFVEPDYMGGWYIFGENSNGLCAIGSTKIGALTGEEHLYRNFGEGHCIGESFKRWFRERYADHEDIFTMRDWSYGLTLLGDPTLSLTDNGAPEAPTGFRYSDDLLKDGLALQWEAPEADDLAGFWLHYDTGGNPLGGYPPFRGTGLGLGDSPIDLGAATTAIISYSDIAEIEELHVALTAYDVRGNESEYSEFLSLLTVPEPSPPRINWAWRDENSSITYSDGGALTLYAEAQDDNDSPGSLSIEIYLDSIPTGILLHDDGTAGDELPMDGIYTSSIDVPAGVIQPGRYLISLKATDSDGMESLVWPYLTVFGVMDGRMASRRGSHKADDGVAGAATEAPEAMLPLHPGTASLMAGGPKILGGLMQWVGDDYGPHAELSFEVYHPVSHERVRDLELYFNSAPTGRRCIKYEADGLTCRFRTWIYASDLPELMGEYVIEAIATDLDGATSDLFPYLWVE